MWDTDERINKKNLLWKMNLLFKEKMEEQILIDRE